MKAMVGSWWMAPVFGFRFTAMPSLSESARSAREVLESEEAMAGSVSVISAREISREQRKVKWAGLGDLLGL